MIRDYTRAAVIVMHASVPMRTPSKSWELAKLSDVPT